MGLAQLRFEFPIVAVLDDRFILRAYSPQKTIGGGAILDPFATKHRSRELASVRERLTLLAGGDHSKQLNQYVIGAGRLGITRSELAARTAWRDDVIESALQSTEIAKSIVRLEATLLARPVYHELRDAIVGEIEAHHKREPLARGFPKETLHDRFFAGASSEVFREAIAQMEKDGAFTSEKEIVKLRDHSRELSTEDAKAKDKLEAAYRNAGVAPPALADAFKHAGLDNTRGRKILQLMLDSGSLVKVHGEMLFHQEALDALIQKLRARAVTQPDRAIDVGSFKELAGISRKYAIPLLEYFDRQRVTRREGDRRIIM
jgi:selenocysteine-specific elongation factor